LASVTLASSSSSGDSNKASFDPPYSLRSNKQAALLSPLHTPCRSRYITWEFQNMAISWCSYS
jgi:hypothetical protein